MPKNNVVDLLDFSIKKNPKRKFQNNLEYLAHCKCLNCQHKWKRRTKTKSQTYALKCPKCHTRKGVLSEMVDPPAGTLVLKCECGNDRFAYMLNMQLFCDQCGAFHTISEIH